MAQRQQVTNHRVTGKIADWKGTFGWIDPNTPISHPDAAKHRGRIYLNITDVEEEIAGVGAVVSFFVYTDGSGLGAMNVKPASSVFPVVKTVTKPATLLQATVKGGKGVSKGSEVAHGRQVVSSAKLSGHITSVKGTFGWITPSQAVAHPLFKGRIYVQQSDMDGTPLEEGIQVVFSLYSDGRGLGASQVRAATNGAPALVSTPAPKAQPRTIPHRNPSATPPTAKEAYGEKPQEQPGPRERIGDVQIIGEVTEWKGAYGWIQPADEVDHPDAAKRRGKVYVAQKDCVGKKTFAPGELVQFYLYTDGTGLGAEECASF